MHLLLCIKSYDRNRELAQIKKDIGYIVPIVIMVIMTKVIYSNIVKYEYQQLNITHSQLLTPNS